jgi:hypothetical protein
MDELVLKVITALGVPGLSIYLAYKLLDRYFAKLVEHFGLFVAATTKQAAATTELVAAVRESGDGQNAVLLAVRSMSAELAALKGWVKEKEEPTQ